MRRLSGLSLTVDENEDFLKATMGSMDMVYNIARRMVPRPEDAQDLVQETYLAAFRAWTEHRRPRAVEPWLATICLNVARSGFRHRARRPQEVPWDQAPVQAEASTDPERDAIEALDRDALHRAMWALPEEQRVAIALVDLAGLSTAEAAEAMQTPRGTVLSRLHRGRRSLALLLGAQIEERDS
jgi:RNA polymerase sigma-70 factor (ECF subfamily)